MRANRSGTSHRIKRFGGIVLGYLVLSMLLVVATSCTRGTSPEVLLGTQLREFMELENEGLIDHGDYIDLKEALIKEHIGSPELP